MTKASIVAATVFVWSAGFAATGALATWVKTPTITSAPVAVLAHATPPPPAEVVGAAPVAVAAEAPTIVLPTVEIVGTTPPPVVAPPKPKAPRDISEMHCAPFRPLEQGSNSVQVCD